MKMSTKIPNPKINRRALMTGGADKYCRCYDNRGATCDQYCVVYTGRYRHRTGGSFWYVTMSGDPFHPQGVGMHGESYNQIDRGNGWAGPSIGRRCHLGWRIPFKQLPDKCKQLVVQDLLDLWGPLPNYDQNQSKN